MFVSQARQAERQAEVHESDFEAPPEGQDVVARTEAREALESELRELSGHLNAGTARLLDLVARHIATEAWAAHIGINSPAAWISWQLGVTTHSAHALVEVATGLEELPAIRACFQAGELSLHQVRILVSICEPDTEAELLRLARGMSAAQLGSFARYYREGLADPADVNHARYARSRYHRDGSYRLSACLPAAEGAIIERALDAAQRALDKDDIRADLEDHDPWAAQRADALVDVATASLEAAEAASESRARYEVIVHADLPTLVGGPGAARVEDGGALSLETLQRIACDCSITTMTTDGAGNINAGRKTRNISRAMRRALHKRDHTCRFPGCARTAFTQAHHIILWTKDGPTDIDNLLRLCWIHHRAVHEGGVTIHQSGDDLEFRRSDGSTIKATPGWSGDVGAVVEQNRAAGTTIDDSTCGPDWGGEPGNMRRVADLMLQARGSPG